VNSCTFLWHKDLLSWHDNCYSFGMKGECEKVDDPRRLWCSTDVE